MVKTPCFQCRWHGFDPWSEKEDSTCLVMCSPHQKLHNYKFKDILQMNQPITIKTSQSWKTKKDWTNRDTYFKRASLVVQMVKDPPAMRETWVRSLAWENPQEEGMATQYSCLENPQGQWSLAGYSLWGSQRVRHDWVTKHSTFTAHIKRDYRDMTKCMVWAWMVFWNIKNFFFFC